MPTTLMLPFCSYYTWSVPEFQVNSDLKYIDRWLKAKTLSLNVAKREFIVIISSRQKLQSLND